MAATAAAETTVLTTTESRHFYDSQNVCPLDEGNLPSFLPLDIASSSLEEALQKSSCQTELSFERRKKANKVDMASKNGQCLCKFDGG